MKTFPALLCASLLWFAAAASAQLMTPPPGIVHPLITAKPLSIVDLGTTNNGAGSSTLVLTTSAACAVGATVVIWVSDSTTSRDIGTVADSVSNAYVLEGGGNPDNVAGNGVAA